MRESRILALRPSPRGIPRDRFGSSIAERLQNRSVRLPNGCLVWMGSRNKYDYGQLWVKKKGKKAHRLAYELAFGPIPSGQCVCHRCDNPPCIEPTHLFLGTIADNNADKESKGRAVVLKGEKVGGAKLTAAEVLAIRASNEANVKLGKQYGVAPSHISRVRRSLKWRHLP